MKDKWIKVSDRLPESDTLYLVRALTAKASNILGLQDITGNIGRHQE